ncbi:hypothetical protein JCM24511_02880 [Saitozyma sp. JCM 24511]|nr:hypothetical protein JCM24511_02880 [Saitozyma sp. JCM 24511]
MLVALSTLLLAGSALAQTFSINTPPSLVQCQPAAISWVGGTSPYILAAIPGGQVSAAALETIDASETGTSTSWTVNLATGSYITLKLTDATGNIAYSSPLTVQAGSSSSCLNSTATAAVASAGATTSVAGASAASGSSAATSAASGSSAAAASTSKAASASSGAASASGSASKAASSASTPVSSGASASAAASSKSAGDRKYELPALVVALLGGVAALV